jgi:hypothetical protein
MISPTNWAFSAPAAGGAIGVRAGLATDAKQIMTSSKDKKGAADVSFAPIMTVADGSTSRILRPQRRR